MLNLAGPFGSFSISFLLLVSAISSVPRAFGKSDFYPSASMSLGNTMMQYKEDPLGVSFTEHLITAKGTAGIQTKQNIFRLDATAFMNLIPLSMSSERWKPARIYGVNLRAGVRVSKKRRATEWWIYSGWYRWGMLVSGNEYGLSALSGPQVYVSWLAKKRSSVQRYVYFKFAPISPDGSFELSSLSHSRELAIGAGIEILPSYTLSLDLADTRYYATDQYENRSSLQSISFGLTWSIR